MPVCPLGVGECGRLLITRALMKPFIPIYADAMAQVQLGDGVKSGATKLIFAGKTHLSMNPDHVVIGIDIKNAFNATSQKHCQYLWENPSLCPLYRFHHAILSPESYLGLGRGQNVIDSQRRSSEGFQDSVEGSIDFDYTAYIAGCQQTNAELEAHPTYGALRAGRDDMYIYGPPEEAFAAFYCLKDRLARINLEIQPSKSICYIHPRFRYNAFEEMREASTIPFGEITDSVGNRYSGIRIFGIPVGEDSYIKTWLEQKATTTLDKFEIFKTLFNPSLHPEPSIPSRQCLFLLTLRCLQHMGSFYVRHLGPSLTGTYANTLDEGINEFIISVRQWKYLPLVLRPVNIFDYPYAFMDVDCSNSLIGGMLSTLEASSVVYHYYMSPEMGMAMTLMSPKGGSIFLLPLTYLDTMHFTHPI